MKIDAPQKIQSKMEENPLNMSQSRVVEVTQCSRPVLYYGRILHGEITPLLSAMKRATPRWSTNHQDNEQDPLVQQLRELQMAITHQKANVILEPNIFLDPFLAIIRSEDTTGPVTKNALAAVNRMLNYGLIDSQHSSAVTAVESVAAAVTHARFVGTDQGADEVVLWEILTVLRTLILGPVGHLLTNESVCEILNSSFRICFETRLSELLRNCTEDALRHMVQMLFARLPQFKDDPQGNQNRKLKMRAGTGNENKGKKGKGRILRASPPPSPTLLCPDVVPEVAENTPLLPSNEESEPISTKTAEVSETDASSADASSAIVNAHSDIILGDNASVDSGITDPTLPSPTEPLDISHTHLAPENIESQDQSPTVEVKCEIDASAEIQDNVEAGDTISEDGSNDTSPNKTRKESLPTSDLKEEFINLQGVKFTQDDMVQDGNSLIPYGLPCVREVFRFLISLTAPTNDQNTSNMIRTALNLLTVALEVGAEHINHIPSLLNLIKNQLCRNLFMLIKIDAKPPIFMASLRVCTLLFESLRTHLKFQLEMFINRLTYIITSESPNILYSYKELALETIVQLWRMPGLITELFLNFDCNLYSSNVFEDLTKVLSKNAFPVQGLYSTNLLSLEALLTVIETIDSHCPRISKKKKQEEFKQFENVSNIHLSNQPAVVAPLSSGYLLGLGLLGGYAPVTPLLKPMYFIGGDQEVCRESLLAVKEKKKLLAIGTEQFNAKAEKGIQFLQDNCIIGLTTADIARFAKDNPHLDKKVIGEYVSKKKNVAILSAFVKSFNFTGLRIDECLRTFLETFRLPGEAPVISIIIEHFSSHWHSSNGTPFEKEDAAFTLAYAVIMLNVDQHNQNAKKQNIPMTVDQFRNNLRGVNDGKDFEPKMLEEIYNAILSEEIVMPAEQTGLLKENYLWKMLLKRGHSKEGDYLLTNRNNSFDKDLFSLCWGPTIASLSYVFDKSYEDSFVQKAITGFKKCASIAARYGMSDVFDNLVVSLCKFTTLTVASNDSPEQVAILFGSNIKAQLAARTVFRLVTSHGDILRDGWKNILELLLQLFRCRLLSSSLIESEDFVEPSGKVSLIRDIPTNIPRVESGLLSSLYSYIALGDVGSTRGTTPEEVELMERAKTCIKECHPEKLITESAFLRYDSLNELLKAMMGAGDANNMTEMVVSPSLKSYNMPGNAQEITCGLDEYSQAFLLELVVSVLVANKDRAGGVWPAVRDHIYSLLMGAAAAEKYFLLERCIVAVLKIAKVLLRRPEMANPILQSLRMLLLLRPHILNRAALQVVSGIYEVLSVNADHIQDPNDWAILFALLECSGAGAKPPPIVNPDAHVEETAEQVSESEAISSGGDSGHCTEPCSLATLSDGDQSGVNRVPDEGVNTLKRPTSFPGPLGDNVEGAKHSRGPSPETIQNPGGWILVGREGEIEPVPVVKSLSVNEWDIVHQRALGEHKADALFKAVDTLAFLVREQHITGAGLPSVVQACRTFVEATLNGVKVLKRTGSKENIKSPSSRRKPSRKKEERAAHSAGGSGGATKRPKSPSGGAASAYDADESDSEDAPLSYQQVSEKLLDLMDTLHTSSSRILNLRATEEETVDGEASSQVRSWSRSVSLWHQALCPLLQGIARYCCDTRNSIRNLAMTYLQRALLNHDLQTLSASEWESCFNKVLFPLLAKLLQPLQPPLQPHLQHSFGGGNASWAMEETRVRAATLVQKVYLRHLTPLLSLPTFTALWLTILDFMDKYLNTHKSDHLNDAIPEILKNMLLVMETTQVFHTCEGFTHLWSITWDRIDAFLPNFRHDLFKSHPPSEIHRIEVVPSESGGAVDVTAGPAERDVTRGPADGHAMCDMTRGPTSAHVMRDVDEKHVHSAPENETQDDERRRLTDHEFVPPSLREQGAVRLSLSQEDLPNNLGSNFILQPPLPLILPVSSSSPLSIPPPPPSSSSTDAPATGTEPFSTQTATLLNQDFSSHFTSLPRFVPPSTLNRFPVTLPPPDCGTAVTPLQSGTPSLLYNPDGGSPLSLNKFGVISPLLNKSERVSPFLNNSESSQTSSPNPAASPVNTETSLPNATSHVQQQTQNTGYQHAYPASDQSITESISQTPGGTKCDPSVELSSVESSPLHSTHTPYYPTGASNNTSVTISCDFNPSPATSHSVAYSSPSHTEHLRSIGSSVPVAEYQVPPQSFVPKGEHVDRLCSFDVHTSSLESGEQIECGERKSSTTSPFRPTSHFFSQGSSMEEFPINSSLKPSTYIEEEEEEVEESPRSNVAGEESQSFEGVV